METGTETVPQPAGETPAATGSWPRWEKYKLLCRCEPAAYFEAAKPQN